MDIFFGGRHSTQYAQWNFMSRSKISIPALVLAFSPTALCSSPFFLGIQCLISGSLVSLSLALSRCSSTPPFSSACGSFRGVLHSSGVQTMKEHTQARGGWKIHGSRGLTWGPQPHMPSWGKGQTQLPVHALRSEGKQRGWREGARVQRGNPFKESSPILYRQLCRKHNFMLWT